jgi:hypothetical protein
MASQMGVSQATGPLGDLSKGVQGMASMLGGQVRLLHYLSTPGDCWGRNGHISAWHMYGCVEAY